MVHAIAISNDIWLHNYMKDKKKYFLKDFFDIKSQKLLLLKPLKTYRRF